MNHPICNFYKTKKKYDNDDSLFSETEILNTLKAENDIFSKYPNFDKLLFPLDVDDGKYKLNDINDIRKLRSFINEGYIYIVFAHIMKQYGINITGSGFIDMYITSITTEKIKTFNDVNYKKLFIRIFKFFRIAKHDATSTVFRTLFDFTMSPKGNSLVIEKNTNQLSKSVIDDINKMQEILVQECYPLLYTVNAYNDDSRMITTFFELMEKYPPNYDNLTGFALHDIEYQ